MSKKLIQLNNEIKELYNEVYHGDSRDKVYFELLYCEKIKELNKLMGNKSDEK